MEESKCPYKKFKNMFSFFNRDNDDTQNLPKTDSEKGIEMTDSPAPDSSKCPFAKQSNSQATITSTFPEEKKKTDDVDSDEDAPHNGCPVMNKVKKDPPNKHFDLFYEVPRFGAFDFLFFMRGMLETDEWLKKTEKLRSYPRHMKYTIFYQNQEKLKKVHEKEFPMVFFIYDDIKQKANRLFRRKKFREAIEHFTYSYGLLKWIEFKDPKKQEEFLKKPSLDPILDDEIIEKHVYLDDVKVEEDSYKACVVFLLMNMAYANMELRHYRNALECIDECIPIAEDKVPDLYFRRSQARTYNRFSKDEDYKQAMEDIEKAIALKDDPMYKEHKEILIKIIEDRNKELLENTQKVIAKAKRSREKLKERNLNLDELIFTKNEDASKQFRILKEMKSKYNLAVKFFTETKNEQQLELTYKEFENFYKSYLTFKFFYKFKVSAIPLKILEKLPEEDKPLLTDELFIRIIDEYKFKLCDDIFGEGNFNFELFQYALEKVFDEDRKKEEEQERLEEERRPKVTWTETLCNISKSSYTKYLSALFILLSIGAIVSHYYVYSGSPMGSLFK